MKISDAGGITALLAIIAAFFVLFLILIKVLWGWVIPDIFPGAVEQGLVAETITLGTAGKLAIFLAVVTAIGGSKK